MLWLDLSFDKFPRMSLTFALGCRLLLVMTAPHACRLCLVKRGGGLNRLSLLRLLFGDNTHRKCLLEARHEDGEHADDGDENQEELSSGDVFFLGLASHDQWRL